MAYEIILDAAAPLILAEDLTRRFGDFVAVDHIHVTVQPGEVFGLLGANGAGKTTAIRMLCGMLPPTAGRIQVAGVDMVRHARRARSQIVYVAQRFSLYGDWWACPSRRRGGSAMNCWPGRGCNWRSRSGGNCGSSSTQRVRWPNFSFDCARSMRN